MIIIIRAFSQVRYKKRKGHKKGEGPKKAIKKRRAKKNFEMREKERQMANNVMREIRIVMGTWYVDFCADSPATAPEILLATS